MGLVPACGAPFCVRIDDREGQIGRQVHCRRPGGTGTARAKFVTLTNPRRSDWPRYRASAVSIWSDLQNSPKNCTQTRQAGSGAPGWLVRGVQPGTRLDQTLCACKGSDKTDHLHVQRVCPLLAICRYKWRVVPQLLAICTYK